MRITRLSKKDKDEKINQSLQKGRLEIETIKDFFSNLSDVSFVQDDEKDKVISFYCTGMTDTVQFNEYYHLVLKKIKNADKKSVETNYDLLYELPPTTYITSIEVLTEKVLSGYLIFYKEGDTFFYGINFAKIPQRVPAESSTEVSIKGPKDAFTEELQVNVSLIRKRLKTEHLFNESFTIGTLSKTSVSLLYLNNKANPKGIEEVRKRLENFSTESATSGQLEQWLSDRTFSLFPLMDNIMRPDFVIDCLLRGRFIIIVDGSPAVLIAPINLLELIKSPEDVHHPYFYVAFQRILRILGFNIAVYLPGFWMAIVSINLDQLPFSLLATVVVSREGLPFPVAIEAFLILGLFELLREASVRMPTPLGQTISIVGGLILGDAAIRSGIAAPSLIVIIAIAAVATYTLVNQSLTGTVTILRIYVLIVSALLGVYGFFLSMFSILIYLCRIESFNLAYLEPFVSLSIKEFLPALFVDPFKRKNFTAAMLQKRRK